MARAIWSGSISFGLLNVPVKLYSAVARRGISLREIRESDGARIRHRRVAEGTDEEVPYEKILKAFEITRATTCRSARTRWRRWRRRRRARSRSRTSSTSTRSTRSTSTAPTTSAPPRAPRRRTRCWPARWRRSGKVAIARFVFRNKEHLAALRADDGVLTLTTMRFADEVVPPDELDDVLPAEKPKVAKKEVEMAEQLIESLTSEFDPSAYRDEYREELLALIERKAEGKEIVAPEAAEPEATKAPDLMAALEESIAAVKGKARRQGARSGGESARKPRRKKPPPKKRCQSQVLEVGRGHRPPGRGRRP